MVKVSPLATSHTRTASPLAAATAHPSGLTPTAEIGFAKPRTTRTHRPDGTSQTRQVVSFPPDTTQVPSGPNAQQITSLS